VSAAASRERGAVALLAFAAVGLAISAYLTVVHYAAVAPVCSLGGVVDCSAVLQSRWSTIPGTAVPVTLPGLLWFAVSGGLAVLALRAAVTGSVASQRLRAMHAGWAAIGMVAVFYFVYAELVELHRICEWCSVVHLLVFASLLVSLARLQPEGAGGEKTGLD